MTKPMRTRLIALLLGLLASTPFDAAAQRLGLSVGYTKLPGSLGDSRSDEGIALRLGAELNPRSMLRFGFEAGMERLNEIRYGFTTSCIHPAGGTATCSFDSRYRDTAWSLAAILRAGPNAGPVRPYVLLGVGVLSVRTHTRSTTTDSTGAHLTNFEFNGTTSDGALAAPLGAGVLFRPAGSPFGLGLEGRVTPVLHNYSGGPVINWSPSLVLGVRFGW
ncbi:MAG TPA: outer membrane beta-barrel protein [Gemmatimonadales bacterium]|nr:outer membrane beta-barrel protein [Gemmatimonadales bacterium]